MPWVKVFSFTCGATGLREGKRHEPSQNHPSSHHTLPLIAMGSALGGLAGMVIAFGIPGGIRLVSPRVPGQNRPQVLQGPGSLLGVASGSLRAEATPSAWSMFSVTTLSGASVLARFSTHSPIAERSAGSVWRRTLLDRVAVMQGRQALGVWLSQEIELFKLFRLVTSR